MVLPDSLLKLDELRGTREDGDDGAVEGKGPSLLDFVAQALVFDFGREPMQLRDEAEHLRVKARAAQGVSLEEAEQSCYQVCQQAARVSQGLREIPPTPGSERIEKKVKEICDESDSVARLLRAAKNELVMTQQWSSAKGKIKGDEWFGGWTECLEQLSNAFGRAKKLQPAVCTRTPLGQSSQVSLNPSISSPPSPTPPKPCTKITQQDVGLGDSKNIIAPMFKVLATLPVATAHSASLRMAPGPVACKLDDNARFEDFNVLMSGLAMPRQGSKDVANKEN